MIFNLDIETDINNIIQAIETSKNLDEKPIHLIIISSLLTWTQTNTYSYFHKHHNEAFNHFLKHFKIPNMIPQPKEEVEE